MGLTPRDSDDNILGRGPNSDVFGSIHVVCLQMQDKQSKDTSLPLVVEPQLSSNLPSSSLPNIVVKDTSPSPSSGGKRHEVEKRQEGLAEFWHVLSPQANTVSGA